MVAFHCNFLAAVIMQEGEQIYPEIGGLGAGEWRGAETRERERQLGTRKLYFTGIEERERDRDRDRDRQTHRHRQRGGWERERNTQTDGQIYGQTGGGGGGGEGGTKCKHVPNIALSFVELH